MNPPSRTDVPGSTRLNLVQRVGLLIILLVTALLLLEGFTSAGLFIGRIYALRPPSDNFRQATYDSLLGWVGIPNLSIKDNYGPGISLHTNAEGMRIHRPVTPALAQGEKRVICSGDSFTFGSGVADSATFCAALERELPGVHTLNMAQRGYGNDQAYLWYRRDGARYPHQVHLLAFIWNDFERMTLRSFFGYSKPILKLKNGQIVTENVPVPPWIGWTRWGQAGAMLPDLRLMQLVQRSVDLSDSAKMARVDVQVWDIAQAVFRDLQRLNRERGSQLVLVYLPTLRDAVPGAYDARRARLATFSKHSGIPLIDLTDEIRTVPTDSLDWLFITPSALPVAGSSEHYSDAGHRWVAARLAEHLRGMPEVARALTPIGSPASSSRGR